MQGARALVLALVLALAPAAPSLAAPAPATGRAVNISNAWILPEEGFPVFYRYFRDRISWYEADAVCQFHHANLVTVDTTAQYDAVRAYLKELDITNNVWLGLIRSDSDAAFTWTNYRGLSGEGYWSTPPDGGMAPLCAAADPAADYRWTARGCGGPSVASFICELPVPQWALGASGCMVRALPALTAVYLPESAAVQLTTDCGLTGLKKVLCSGNKNRENILKELSCGEVEVEVTSATAAPPPSSTVSATDATVDARERTTTADARERTTTASDSGQLSTAGALSAVRGLGVDDRARHELADTRLNSIASGKRIQIDMLLNDNLQSNEIPKIVHQEDLLTNRLREKQETDIDAHSKQLFHDEVARLGNFETIFTQPTDRFIPPLVMAKAKLSDDTKVLTPGEKHAQRAATLSRVARVHSEEDLQRPPLNTFTTPSSGADAAHGNIPYETKKHEPGKSTKSNLPKKYDPKKYDSKKQFSKPNSTPQPRHEVEVMVPEATAANPASFTILITTKSLPMTISSPGQPNAGISDTVDLKLSLVAPMTVANKWTEDGRSGSTYVPEPAAAAATAEPTRVRAAHNTDSTSSDAAITPDLAATVDREASTTASYSSSTDDATHGGPRGSSAPESASSSVAPTRGAGGDTSILLDNTPETLPSIIPRNESKNNDATVTASATLTTADRPRPPEKLQTPLAPATTSVSDARLEGVEGVEGVEALEVSAEVTEREAEFVSPLLSGAEEPAPALPARRSRRLQELAAAHARRSFNPFRILG